MVKRTEVRFGSDYSNLHFHSIYVGVSIPNEYNINGLRMNNNVLGLLEPLVRRGSYKYTNGNSSGELIMHNIYHGYREYLSSFPYVWDSDIRVGYKNRSSLRFDDINYTYGK